MDPTKAKEFIALQLNFERLQISYSHAIRRLEFGKVRLERDLIRYDQFVGADINHIFRKFFVTVHSGFNTTY